MIPGTGKYDSNKFEGSRNSSANEAFSTTLSWKVHAKHARIRKMALHAKC